MYVKGVWHPNSTTRTRREAQAALDLTRYIHRYDLNPMPYVKGSKK